MNETSSMFKIVEAEVWEAIEGQPSWEGSPLDRRDGFIHLSTAEQVETTLERHFSGRSGLVLLELDPSGWTSEILRWEQAPRGGCYPHLYGPLELDRVRRIHVLELDADGRHVRPDIG